MTEDQVETIVTNLCTQLKVAARQQDPSGKPVVVKDLVFDHDEVKTALRTGLNAAGIAVVP